MHFLDAWTELPTLHLVRMLLPAALLVLVVFLPGRPIARVIAAAVALAMLGLGELGPRWPIGAAWAALWLAVAWGAGGTAPRARAAPGTRAAGVESGAVGLLLGLTLLSLLAAAVARQDLSPEVGRRVSYGLLLLSLGLLHLMLRRDALRATLAFATLGLGLQVLERASRDALLPDAARDPGLVWFATVVVVALASRLARARQRAAGSAWVSDAHDLHD